MNEAVVPTGKAVRLPTTVWEEGERFVLRITYTPQFHMVRLVASERMIEAPDRDSFIRAIDTVPTERR